MDARSLEDRLDHRIDQALKGLVSSRSVLLRVCLLLGLSVSMLSIPFALVSLGVNVIHVRPLTPPGISTLIVALCLFAGLPLSFPGELGESPAASQGQVRKRPLMIERSQVEERVGAPARTGSIVTVHPAHVLRSNHLRWQVPLEMSPPPRVGRIPPTRSIAVGL